MTPAVLTDPADLALWARLEELVAEGEIQALADLCASCPKLHETATCKSCPHLQEKSHD